MIRAERPSDAQLQMYPVCPARELRDHWAARLWKNGEVEDATDESACKQTAVTCAVGKKATRPAESYQGEKTSAADAPVASWFCKASMQS